MNGLESTPRFAVAAAVLALAACGGGNGDETVRAPAAERSAVSEKSTDDFPLGEARNDIERFFGLYGDPAAPGNPRGQVFVIEAKRPKFAEQAPEIPPGYLAIGAMWGDVAPMYMKSVSEATFEQVDLGDFAPAEPNVAEFELGPDGKAFGLTFTSGGFSRLGRLARIGDSPPDWQ